MPPSVPPMPKTDEWRYLKGGSVNHDSAALLDDGRYIYIYTSGTSLMQCYYIDERAFTRAANDLCSTPYNIALQVGQDPGTWGKPRATVFRTNNGGLYMTLGCIKSNLKGFYVYVSPSGTGESSPGVSDWQLVSTIWLGTNYNSDQLNSWNSQYICVSRPLEVGNRWVLSLPYRGGVNDNTQACYTSENGPNGPWTVRWTMHYYGFAGYGYGQSRQIVVHQNKMFISTTGNVWAAQCYWSNANDGINWNYYERGANSSTNDYLFVSGGYIYKAWSDIRNDYHPYSTTNANIFRTSMDPSAIGDYTGWEHVLEIRNWFGVGYGFTEQYAVPLSVPGQYSLIYRGRLLATGRTWWVGEVGMN